MWGARSPDNAASHRVMSSAGMVVEGRIRRHVHTDSGWRDSVVYSILSDEWRASDPARGTVSGDAPR